MLFLWSKCLTNKSDSNSEPDLSRTLHITLQGRGSAPIFEKRKKKDGPYECATLKKKKKKKKIKFPLGFPSSWENVVTIYVSQLSAQWCPTANSWCSFYVFSPLPLKAVHHCIKSFVAPDEAAFHLVNCLRWCHLVTMLHCGWCRRQVLKWNKNVKPT